MASISPVKRLPLKSLYEQFNKTNCKPSYPSYIFCTTLESNKEGGMLPVKIFLATFLNKQFVSDHN